MQQRQLGKTGLHLSAIGIGAMSFTDFYGKTSEAESHRLLTAALDLGVNHIDTANVYGGGLSETVIGSFLAKQGRKKPAFSILPPKPVSLSTRQVGAVISTIARPICRPSLTHH